MEQDTKAKAHRKRQSGPKAEKKKKKKNSTGEGLNPKAFTHKYVSASLIMVTKLQIQTPHIHARFHVCTCRSVVRAARAVRRNLDRDSKRQHVPTVDRTPLEPPPMCVAIVGPPRVGKTLLLQCLLKNYTRQNLTNLRGPITVVSGMLSSPNC